MRDILLSKSLMEPRLFTNKAEAPWAEAWRPTGLTDFVGQQHLVGPNGPLHNGSLHSLLLWGPPGCGKTTLARLLAERAGAGWEAISPVAAGVKELRACVARAQDRRDERAVTTVVFVDEAHRFNKSQQDYFLPHVETGLLTFIGATTENPSFEINAALLSRITVYRLDPLNLDDLKLLFDRVVTAKNLTVTAAAERQVLADADGDARRMFNTLETLAASSGSYQRG